MNKIFFRSFACVILALLYWSNTVLEEDIKALGKKVESLALKIEDDSHAVAALKGDIIAAIDKNHEQSYKKLRQWAVQTPQVTLKADSDVIGANLLKEDRYFSEVLPKLLGEQFRPQGTWKTAMVSKPNDLHPFNNYAGISDLVRQCTCTVAGGQFGYYETMTGAAATSVELKKNEETGKDEFFVKLRPDLYWEPLSQELVSTTLAPWFLQRHKVTARDFKFYFDAIRNESVQDPGAVALRSYLQDIEEFRVIDDETFTLCWKQEMHGDKFRMAYTAKAWTGALRPLACFVYQYFADGSKIVDDSDPQTYATNSVWAQNFHEHWAKNIIPSCGPWLFDGMTDEKIRLRRNPRYFDRYAALVEAIEVRFYENPESLWQDFKAGAIDSYTLRSDQLQEFEDFLKSTQYAEQKERGMGIARLDYVSRVYNYLAFNMKRPLFASKNVRQALTLAIDRKRIIRQNQNDMAQELTGPFFPYSPSYDSGLSPYPFDPSRAARMLAEEGWYDSDGDGIIDKEIDGKRVPFSFHLTYYVKNPSSKINAEYIATAFKEIGIACELNGVELHDLSAAFDDKDFDSLYMGWQLGSPPEDPRQLWHSSGADEKGSSNMVGFANTEADSLIEQLAYESDIVKRNSAYHRFHRIIYDEAPYVFLYVPKTVYLYREYVKNVFIPKDRQDILPGATVVEPDFSVFWLEKTDQ